MPYKQRALKAVVFDFDGVVVDSEPLHWRAFADGVEPEGMKLDYPMYLKRYVGFDDHDAIGQMLADIGKPASAEKLEKLVKNKQADFDRLARKETRAMPGALALIERLTNQGLALAIASGATRRDIDLMLDCLGWAHYFQVIVSADDVALSKPDPASYADAVALLAQHHPHAQISPAQCLAIEDTPAGIESAHAAGLQTLALRTTMPNEPFDTADEVVDDLGDEMICGLKNFGHGD